MSITGDPREYLANLLNITVGMGGSDLHLRVDSPPQIRVHGLLQKGPVFDRKSPQAFLE